MGPATKRMSPNQVSLVERDMRKRTVHLLLLSFRFHTLISQRPSTRAILFFSKVNLSTTQS